MKTTYRTIIWSPNKMEETTAKNKCHRGTLHTHRCKPKRLHTETKKEEEVAHNSRRRTRVVTAVFESIAEVPGQEEKIEALQAVAPNLTSTTLSMSTRATVGFVDS